MANYKWVNGQLVDTELGTGLGNMRVDTPTKAIPNNSYIEDYWGKGATTFGDTAAEIPKSTAATSLLGTKKGLAYDPNTGSYNTDGWTEEQWAKFGAGGGTVDGDKLMFEGKQINAPSTSSLFGDDGFGMNKGTLEGLGSIGNIGVGLGRLFLGSKQLGLAEDKFAFDKDMLNKQYAMSKDNYDKQTARSASIGSQMTAGKVG